MSDRGADRKQMPYGSNTLTIPFTVRPSPARAKSEISGNPEPASDGGRETEQLRPVPFPVR